MGDLTKNISRHELACKCGCGFDTMDWQTITVVQELCSWAEQYQQVDKVVLRINSAARCQAHNTAINGSKNSQHTKARAMDIVIVGIKPVVLFEYLSSKYTGLFGVGRYDTFTHIDTRSGPGARW